MHAGEFSQPAGRALGGNRLRTIVVENALAIAVLCEIAVILAALSHRLFAGDSWMTLVAGREVARDGIPDREILTLLPAGERWIDQQWLAQLLWYGSERMGDLAAVALIDVVVVVGAYASGIAAARLLGAPIRAAVLVALACMLAAPWSWNVRAQPLAFPLFVWTLYLAAQHVRQPSMRILLALPILLVWANIHGSVLIGAALVSLAVLWAAIGRGRTDPSGRSVVRTGALVLAAWLCALATPYGPDILGYYHRLLVDPPFGNAVVEWDRTKLEAGTALFFIVAALAAVLVTWKHRRMTPFEIVVLALLFVGALEAARGIAWFVLAVAVLVPNALGGILSRPATVKHPRVNLWVAGLSVTVLLIAFAVVAAKPTSWFEQDWPRPMLTEVASAGPNARVFPSDRHASWLLWNLPQLRGRMAYDTRFELLSKKTFRSLLAWNSQTDDDWKRAADGYDLIVIWKPEQHPRFLELLAEPEARIVYRDDDAVLIRRSTTGFRS